MPAALNPESNPNYFIPAQYPGAGAFRPALSYFMRGEFGPEMTVDPELLNRAAGGYYSTPGTGDIGGAGRATAQGAFGNLLLGQAGAANSALQQAAQHKALAGQGINATATDTGNAIAQALSSHIALNNARSQYEMRNLGLLSSLISSGLQPTGGGSLVPTPGGGFTQQRGPSLFSSLLGGGSSLFDSLSGLFGPSAAGAFPGPGATLADFAAVP